MRFGTIGAGEVALAFGREALARGHEVVLSSRRGPDALVDKVAELGRGASAASVEEAASLDYVLLAVPWRNVESALKSLPAWSGRVLIDATNPFVETTAKLVLADLGGKGASEVVAALAPGARIVKAFNSIVTARFKEGPVKNGGRRVIFVSGGPSRSDRIHQTAHREFRFRGDRSRRSRDGWPPAAGRGSARRSRPRRIRPSLTREAQNACSANQNFRRARNRPRTCRPSRTSSTGRRRGTDRCRACADQHE
jgi:predicted dinucleotide-binding enzyme